jgi:hypothetical protein
VPVVWVAVLVSIGCASPPAAEMPIPDAPPLTPGALRVRLVFDAHVDLDLYVTGPRLETVYFANTESREGGILEADRRCDAPAPRVESVVFPGATTGLYRVGVDFMMRCDGSTDESRYRIVFENPDGTSQLVRGTARFGVFESRVLERTIER